MKFARMWSWLGRRSRRTGPANRRILGLVHLEERAVPALFAVGSGGGALDGTAKVFDDNGVLKATLKPFPIGNTGNFFKVGVDCAMGDVNHDGVIDLVVAAGPNGGPHVKVYDGKSINQIADPNAISNPTVLKDFFAFEATFAGGVNVAAGDVNGDGFSDIICGAGAGGGPKVVVYNGNTSSQLMNFFPFETTFGGGVDVASGDLGGDVVTDEIVCGAGNGGGPKVIAFNFVPNANVGLTARKLTEFFAGDSNARRGVNVGVGYYTNNRDAQNFLYADIATGSGQGLPNNARVYRLLDAVNDPQGNPAWLYFKAADFAPYTNFQGGVRVGSVARGGGGLDDLSTGPYSNGGPDLKIWNQTQIGDLVTYTPTLRFETFVFDASYSAGIYVS